MPLYEYECTACHRRTEKIQKFSDPEITACPHCGAELKRVLSAPAFSLKGGGWYADGYGSAKPAAAAGEGKTDGAGKTDSVAATGAKDGAKDGGSSTPAAAPAAAAPAASTSSPAASAPASSGASSEKK